jgi:hypothetical protein
MLAKIRAKALLSREVRVGRFARNARRQSRRAPWRREEVYHHAARRGFASPRRISSASAQSGFARSSLRPSVACWSDEETHPPSSMRFDPRLISTTLPRTFARGTKDATSHTSRRRGLEDDDVAAARLRVSVRDRENAIVLVRFAAGRRPTAVQRRLHGRGRHPIGMPVTARAPGSEHNQCQARDASHEDTPFMTSTSRPDAQGRRRTDAPRRREASPARSPRSGVPTLH